MHLRNDTRMIQTNDATPRHHDGVFDQIVDTWARHAIASNGFGDGGEAADPGPKVIRRRSVAASPARRTPIVAATFAALMGLLVVAARRALR